MLDWKKQPRFYLNPTTGRLIKSTARVYKKLKKDSILMLRDKCLYNPKSAQRCLTKLLTLYPNVYPPSNFIKIPKTHKRGSIRAFIKDPRKKYLVGYINKFGKAFRLRRPIITKKKVPIVIDYHNVLHKIITNKNCITENSQKRVEKQIKAGILLNTIENTIILFNPIQNDFIPINKTINQDEIKSVIKMINNRLIPHELQPITINLNISAIIIEDNKIIGFVDKYNQLKRFTTPIKIISKRKYTPLTELTEEPEITEPELLLEKVGPKPSKPEEETEEEITEEETTEEEIPETITEPEITEEEEEEEVPEEITKTLPSVTTIKGDDYIDLKEKLEGSPEVEPKEIAEQIRCLEGEQFDVNEQRCLPCTHYGLVWDSQYKLCKQMLKEDIMEQKDDHIDIKTNKLKILFDTNDNIIGFLEN